MLNIYKTDLETNDFKKIKEFELSGYVCKGLKDGRADTFFITEKGCLALECIRDGKRGLNEG